MEAASLFSILKNDLRAQAKALRAGTVLGCRSRLWEPLLSAPTSHSFPRPVHSTLKTQALTSSLGSYKSHLTISPL